MAIPLVVASAAVLGTGMLLERKHDGPAPGHVTSRAQGGFQGPQVPRVRYEDFSSVIATAPTDAEQFAPVQGLPDSTNNAIIAPGGPRPNGAPPGAGKVDRYSRMQRTQERTGYEQEFKWGPNQGFLDRTVVEEGLRRGKRYNRENVIGKLSFSDANATNRGQIVPNRDTTRRPRAYRGPISEETIINVQSRLDSNLQTMPSFNTYTRADMPSLPPANADVHEVEYFRQGNPSSNFAQRPNKLESVDQSWYADFEKDPNMGHSRS